VLAETAQMSRDAFNSAIDVRMEQRINCQSGQRTASDRRVRRRWAVRTGRSLQEVEFWREEMEDRIRACGRKSITLSAAIGSAAQGST